MKYTIDKMKDAQGYLWYSDRNEPIIIHKDFELDLDDEVNPFVIEGFICNSELSVSIKYVDGEYFINKYKLTPEDRNSEVDKDDILTFRANRMPGKSQLIFRQKWQLKADVLCEGMEVLRPSELIFIGFK